MNADQYNASMRYSKCTKCGGTGKVPDREQLCAALKKLRERAGISQASAARALGVSRQRLNDLEMGRRPWHHKLEAEFRALIGKR